jgi:peptide deformylase
VRLKIVQAGDPILRQTARPLTHQEILGDEIQRLIQDQKSAAM